jgi:DNA-binding response OmpR family regulator
MVTAVEQRPLVLIIEDDKNMAEAWSLLLTDWGYSYVAADSAGAAVRALGPRVGEVRAVITDYHLVDGFTGVTGAVAIANAIGHPVPTLVTTGFSELGKNLVTFPVLAKPFDPDVLRQWLSFQIKRDAPSQ